MTNLHLNSKDNEMNSMQRFSRLDGGEKQVCSPTKLSFNKCNTALKQA